MVALTKASNLATHVLVSHVCMCGCLSDLHSWMTRHLSWLIDTHQLHPTFKS